MNIQGTPHAVFLSRQGTVTGKGLVNNYEHLNGLRLAALAQENTDNVVVSSQ
jgi:hypothetical protein